MAKASLASMSFDALVKLRDDVGEMLTRQAAEMQKQLARITGTDVGNGRSGRKAKQKGSPLKGRKAAVKYRDKSGNAWSGRGAQPRWMTAAVKAGAKRDDFLVAKSGASAAKAKPVKRKAKR
jgi:DNA-binding protein H-NS